MATSARASPFDKSLIYKLLNNRTYLGKLRDKTQWYPGEHEPVIAGALGGGGGASHPRHQRPTAGQRHACRSCSIAFGTDGRALTP